MRNRTTAELAAIVAAGGGLKMSMKNRTTAELQQLAATAGTAARRPRIVFYYLIERTAAELQAIAAAGSGCVVFSDEDEDE